MVRSKLIKDIVVEMHTRLRELQQVNGEFPSYGVSQEGEEFYLGISPFLTGHITCLLIESKHDKLLHELIEKTAQFLDSLDQSGLRLYKFWYGHVNKTSFIQLPFDLDDTATVNQVFLLLNEKVVSTGLIKQNINQQGQFETWWKPSLSLWIKNLKHTQTILKHLLSYTLFFSKHEGVPMAEYSDSELIIRLNIYTLLEIAHSEYVYSETYLPITKIEVQEELSKSLHYINESVYYYYLCRFHYYGKKLKTKDLNLLIQVLGDEINALIKRPEKAGDVFLLLVSISYLRPLSEEELAIALSQYHKNTWQKAPILFCVGNKKYPNYHQYYSPAFTYALILHLFANAE